MKLIIAKTLKKCEIPSLKFLIKLIHFCSLHDYFEYLHCSSMLFKENTYLANKKYSRVILFYMIQIYGHFAPKNSGNKVKGMFFFLS